ncbi:MAG: nucleotidyltransferase family protein [Nitrososphaerota archaeon]|nr:nucleotidyltransferase family protein [Candidatus Geocrenenecus dongiae]
MLCGVILAGGLSERFGCDKYLWNVNDKPIISIVAFALREISDRIYLLTRDKTRAAQLSEITGVENYILDDVNINCGGPLRGLLTALLKVDSEEYLIIPGDLPWIDGLSLKRFVERCRESRAECGSIVWGDGSLSSTIQYFNSDARQYLSEIAKLRGIYGRATDTFRSCRRVLLTHVSNITDEPKKLVGVNFQKDIISPQIPPIYGFINNDIYIKRSSLNFLTAVKLESMGDLENALKMYVSEVEEYLDLNIYHLALHALIDAKRCSSMEEKEIDQQIIECVSRLGWNKVKRHIPK